MDYLLYALNKYVNFIGCTNAKNFWMYLWYLLKYFIIISIVSVLLGFGGLYDIVFVLPAVYCLTFCIPSISITVRRLHDVGKSGWLYFLILIPFLGACVLLIICAGKSKFEGNKYRKIWEEVPKSYNKE